VGAWIYETEISDRWRERRGIENGDVFINVMRGIRATAVSRSDWLDGFAWQNLKCPKKVCIVAPRVCLAICLSQPDNDRLLCRST
jgi:hypothetical protein